MRISVAISLFILSACASDPSKSTMLRFSTYNIRLDTASDGENAWPNRKDSVTSLMQFYAPDVFGMQEVRQNQLAELKSRLNAYDFVGVGRDDGREGGEFSSLAFRRDRFELVGQGTFWLSSTPNEPSIGWGAAFPRIVTWAHLKERQSGAVILVLNTHWDHAEHRARLESGRLIRQWIGANRAPCESVVLLGDFNATPEEDSYGKLVEPGDSALADAMNRSETPPFGPIGTFNGFDIESAPSEAIDHIFVSKGVRILRHGTITQQEAGRLPSDHYPVIVDALVPNCEKRIASAG